jgi:putative tryptophan/tyrosine transport system substrate-binding protein
MAIHIRRREFIVTLGSAVTWPLTARSQQHAKIARIGFLGLAPASIFRTRLDALRAGLREVGLIEGKNIEIEFRWADSMDQLPELAAELVRMNVDIIFAPASTFVEPARQATKTIPIVFATHADPLGTGHVATLAHPGGNITGLSVLMTELAAKNLEILKEALPQITRIGVLWNPTTPTHIPALKSVEASAEKLGVELRMVPARTVEDFDGAYATMTQVHVGGFLVLGAPSSYQEHGVRLAELALKHRLPGIFWFRENVEAGGLMSYSPDVLDLYRRSAVYIDKILKGAKPADLPVEQASKYQLVINLKTAKALGLEIPTTLLARADEVIE